MRLLEFKFGYLNIKTDNYVGKFWYISQKNRYWYRNNESLLIRKDTFLNYYYL